MHIKWTNVIALALILTALIVTLKFSRQAQGTLSMLTAIGPGHAVEDQTVGLLVLGLLGVTIVAVTRILTTRHDPNT